MRAVLINTARVRLGEVDVSESCRIIEFGDGFFVFVARDGAVLDGGGIGALFEQADVNVIKHLDIYDPRTLAHPLPNRR